jgi:hypothetical protein
VNWTRERPAQAGYYWLRKHDAIEELDFDPDGRLAIVKCGGRLIPCPLGEEFYGPLEKPP